MTNYNVIDERTLEIRLHEDLRLCLHENSEQLEYILNTLSSRYAAIMLGAVWLEVGRGEGLLQVDSV